MKSDPYANNDVNRREFIRLGLAFSLAALIGQAGIALFRFVKPPSESGAGSDVVLAGQVEEFVPGTISHVQKGRCYISRLEDGGFLALSQRCTHLGCTVPWREDEGRFNCPCHSSIFTPTGEVVSGPAPRPLDLFQIEIKDGQILVDASRPVERTSFEPPQVTYA